MCDLSAEAALFLRVVLPPFFLLSVDVPIAFSMLRCDPGTPVYIHI